MLIIPVRSHAYSAYPGIAEGEVHVLPYYLRNDDKRELSLLVFPKSSEFLASLHPGVGDVLFLCV